MLLGTGRFGRAPLRTPAQLAEILPVPLYLYFSGYVSLVYPTTSRAAPSDAVGFQPIKTLPSWVTTNAFPLWISGRQWENTVVPLLNDPRLTQWRGVIGIPLTSPIRLPVTVNPPPTLLDPNGGCGQAAILDGTALTEGTIIGQGPSTDSVGTLYACDWSEVKRSQGRAKEYLTLLHGISDSYARGAYLSVNKTPATASLVIGSAILAPVSGPRVSGANNYDNRGTPSQIAASVIAALNDPMNDFAALVYAFAPVVQGGTLNAFYLVSIGNPAVVGAGGLRIGTTDQTVSLVGSAP